MVPKPPAFLGDKDSNSGPWARAAVAQTLTALWLWLWLWGSLGRGTLLFTWFSFFLFVFVFLEKKKKPNQQLKPQGVKAKKRPPLPLRNGDRQEVRGKRDAPQPPCAQAPGSGRAW